MKRHIVAVALAVLAAPALALETDAPYEQLAVDRALPNLPVERAQFAAAAGSTRSDVEISTGEAVRLTTGPGLAAGPWANDYHFIAPAQ